MAADVSGCTTSVIRSSVFIASDWLGAQRMTSGEYPRRRDARKTLCRDLNRGHPRRRYRNMQLCEPGNGHSPVHKRHQSWNHPFAECRMRKWVLVHTVLVYQPTPGLMEKAGIYCDARQVRTKSHLSNVPGHRPRRKELRDVP